MQEDNKTLRLAISKTVSELRKLHNKPYLKFCDENSIATSTYDNIINGTSNTTVYNLSKIIKGLGLTFSSFGELLDKNLPQKFWDEE